MIRRYLVIYVPLCESRSYFQPHRTLSHVNSVSPRSYYTLRAPLGWFTSAYVMNKRWKSIYKHFRAIIALVYFSEICARVLFRNMRSFRFCDLPLLRFRAQGFYAYLVIFQTFSIRNLYTHCAYVVYGRIFSREGRTTRWTSHIKHFANRLKFKRKKYEKNLNRLALNFALVLERRKNRNCTHFIASISFVVAQPLSFSTCTSRAAFRTLVFIRGSFSTCHFPSYESKKWFVFIEFQ